MKLRRRKFSKITRLRSVFNYGWPVWNGLITTYSTENAEKIEYLRKRSFYGKKVYIYSTEINKELRKKYSISSYIMSGVGYVCKHGVLMADAMTDDKQLYFLPWTWISCWSRLKFIGCKDVFGAYKELDTFNDCNNADMLEKPTKINKISENSYEFQNIECF